MTTQTITLSHTQLVELTRKVFPHASTDTMLPVICAIKIETRGKWLLAYATDRFSAGLQRIAKVRTDESPETEWPPFEALVGAKDLKALLAHYKPARGALSADLSLTVDDGLMRVETISGGFDLFDSAHTTYRLVAGQYPAILTLITGALHGTTESTTSCGGFNPLYLARFAQTGRRHEAVQYRFPANPTKPLVVVDGDGFIGILMPRRLLDAATPTSPIEDWTDLLPALAAPKAVEA